MNTVGIAREHAALKRMTVKELWTRSIRWRSRYPRALQGGTGSARTPPARTPRPGPYDRGGRPLWITDAPSPVAG